MMRFLPMAIMMLFVQNGIAQTFPDCGTDLFQSLHATADPAWKASQEHLTEVFNKALRRYAKTAMEGSAAMDHIDTIALAMHVIHTGGAIGTKYNPSDEAIQNDIGVTNQFFAGTYPGSETGFDMGVRFILAKRDPQCGATTGIDRIDGTVLNDYSKGILSGSNGITISDLENFIKWDPGKYLNVWLVNILNDGKTGGVGYYPTDSTMYGVILEAEEIGYRSLALAHELGHTLSLRHPFEGGGLNTCPDNTDCNLDNDGICDTDPISQPAAGNICRTGLNPCTATNYSALTEHNIMNYSLCKTLFTEGQHMRAKAALATSPLLLSLLHADSRFLPEEYGNCFMGLHLNGDISLHTAHLNWNHDNIRSDYHLERSYDGFHFSTIAVFQFSDGSGVFSFSDRNITQESTSYRLYQQTDSNKIYSNTVILMDSTKTAFPVSLLGNPIASTLDIQIGDIPQKTMYVYATTLSLRLMNLLGQTVFTYTTDVHNTQRLRIPVAFLRPGTYILQATINDHQFLFQVLKN